MLSLSFIRENPDIVRAAITNKSVKVDLDVFFEVDERRRALQQEVESLRAQKNEISASLKGVTGKPDPAILEQAKTIKDRLQVLEKEFEILDAEHLVLWKKIPNIPTDDTPIGHTEDENVVVYEWGEKPEFSFVPRNHADIAALHGWIDKERAANVAGARFAYLMGDLVQLQFALIQFVMKTLTNEKILQKIITDLGLNISSKPFTPILPPYMIRTEPYDAMDRLEPREDRYKIE